MAEPREPTQMVKVQQMLLSGPVCATTFLREFISAGRSRVSDLKTKHGWSISTGVCDEHNHKTRQIRYRLTHDALCRCPKCQRSDSLVSVFVTGEQLSLV